MRTAGCIRRIDLAADRRPGSACADPTLTLEDFEHEPCWIGVDLAERDDIAAVALVFQRDGPRLRVRARLSAGARRQRAGARGAGVSRTGSQSGELIVTDGNLTDYPTIEADLRKPTASGST